MSGIHPARRPDLFLQLTASIDSRLVRRLEASCKSPCENNPVIPRRFVFVLLSIILTSPLYAASQQDDEMAGAVLFRDKGCAHCHGVGGVGTQKAPSLVDIRKDKVWTPDRMTEQILHGGQKMPPFADSLSDPEIAQIVAYLRAKHRPVPPPVQGN
jgi:mono/diheme cytochrome c family protein